MERNKKSQPTNPREKANLLSIVSFFWTLKIFIKGSKRPLDLDDIYETLECDKSDAVGDRLERYYLIEVEKCNTLRKRLGITDPQKGPQASLGKALFKTFWLDFTMTGFIILTKEIVRLLNTILLGKLLEYFHPDSTTKKGEALWIAGAMIVLIIVNSLSQNHYIMGAMHMGMRARVAVCSLIYRKSLRISHISLGESVQGKVVNLLSNDVSRFDIVSVVLHYFWISPLIAFVILYFLYKEVGPSGILGVIVVFSIVPIQGYAGKLSAKFRLQTALKTDERVRFMGEIISGVQVIKMYAWEKPFQALITLARRLEIKVIRKNSYVRAIYMTFLLTTTRIAMFFVMFSMVLFGNKLSSAKVFVIATYFHLLASTISSMFVRAIAEVAEAYVALKRLQKYLGNEEFVPLPVKVMDVDLKLNGFGESPRKEDAITGSRAKPNIIIKAVNLEARWLPDKPLTLDLDTLEIPRGKLIGVIGPVGCGKVK